MADQTSVLPGRKFNLYRESDTVPGTYEFFCPADNVNFSQNNTFNDTTRSNCDTPTAIPTATREVSLQTRTISFSGKVDLARRRLLQADFDAAAGNEYQLKFEETGANGGGAYSGTLKFDSIVFAKDAPNGNVTFEATAQFEGAVPWANAA